MNNSQISYSIVPKKKKKKAVSAKKNDESGHAKSARNKASLARISTDPDMRSTFGISIPALMQTATLLTPIEHAKETPSGSPDHGEPKPHLYHKQTAAAHFNNKRLPSMPMNRPLPSNPTILSKPMPLTTTTRKNPPTSNGNATITTTTTFITYIDPNTSVSKARNRGMSIPAYIPLGSTQNEMKQLHFTETSTNHHVAPHDMNVISFGNKQQSSFKNVYNNNSNKTMVFTNNNNHYTKHKKPVSSTMHNIAYAGLTNYNNDEYDMDNNTSVDELNYVQSESKSAGDLTSAKVNRGNRPNRKHSIKKRTKTFSGTGAGTSHHLSPRTPQRRTSQRRTSQRRTPRRRLSDTEVVTPTANSPYHPNNYASSAAPKWYKSRIERKIEIPRNVLQTAQPIYSPKTKPVFQKRTSMTSFNHPKRTSSKKQYAVRHRTKHSQSSAIPPPPIPPPFVPKKGVSFSPETASKYVQFTPPMPAPFVPRAPQSTPLRPQQSPQRPLFDLGMILLPNQERKSEEWESDDDSEPSVTDVPTLRTQHSLKPRETEQKHRIKKVRRNSDTIVYTPTASAISDSTFYDAMNNAPQMKHMHVRHSIRAPDALREQLKYITDETPVSTTSESVADSMYVHEATSVRSNSIVSNRTVMSNRSYATHRPNLSLVQEIVTTNYTTDDIPYDSVDNKGRHRRNQSAPETPSRTDTNTPMLYSIQQDELSQLPLPKETPNKPTPILAHSYLPPKHVSMIHETNKTFIDKILGFKGNAWNFDNELVDVFHEQCKNVKYENIVPSLVDILYPTMLSSLALPASAKSATYYMSVRYNLSSFVSVEEQISKHSPIVGGNTHNKLYAVALTFSFKTTIRMAVEEIVFKIKQNHAQYSHYMNRLHLHCFVLKVCGREEYLKPDGNNNKIIALSYIRNCIRRNELNDMQLALLYDDSLNEHNDINMRQTLRSSYDQYYHKQENALNYNSPNKLKYEQMGYNVITDTLARTIGDNVDKLRRNLDELNKNIEDEMLWLKGKIGSVYGGNNTSITHEFGYNTFNTLKSDMTEFKWNEVNKEAVLLPEFEHPVEFQIESLTNMMLCPRFRMKNNEYYIYVLRIELMFGIHVFEDCSWDIYIPKSELSNNIEMPPEYCTFSTEEACLHYSSLPRESVWTFTLYGIKNDKEMEKEWKEKKKKQDKMQKKKEPKILRAFIKKQQSGRSLGSTQFATSSEGAATDGIFSKTKAEDFGQLIGNESINDFYNANRTNTTRSVFSYDGDNDEEETKSHYVSEPMAWCRLPMIDHNHCLRKGGLSLKLWTVPQFEKVKGGPKIDPYTTGNWKKFGSMRDCNLSKKSKLNSVVLSINFILSYTFDVVAPICNQRRPHYIRTKIKAHKGKEFSGAKVLNDIIQRDGIYPLDERDKLLVYSNKDKLMRDPATIPTFLRSVSWLDQESRMEAYDYLQKWCAPKNPEDMIELLRYEFADNRIRLYAINCLNQLDDYTLNRCLLQLVQALKNEAHHSSFLARFLIVRALRNPFQIGHYLFWHLKSEYHDNNLQFVERYGLLLREYLLHLPYYPLYSNINLAKRLYDENNLIQRLKFISLSLKNAKAKKKWSNKNLLNLLQNELMRLNVEFFPDPTKSMTLPLNPSYKVGRLQFDRCRFMSSAKAPLWLVFSCFDRYCAESTISVMFKCGDDLRQDILTLQLISIMDAFWLSSSIDLNMRTYQVIGTGYQVGMLELILNSKTTNSIGSSFNNKSHLKYIMSKTPINKHLSQQERKANYARSVAGFSVATWTLGIGDRHPDNIMIHEDGTLFHIDFGHFLGNFKEKDIGGLVKWKRERTPFVFTNAMKYCIEGTQKKKSQRESYHEFVKWLWRAYCEIRTRYKFFSNLLLLMVPSQMPELITESDVAFFREILRFDLTDARSVAVHVEATLKLCLADKNKKFDDMMHKIHHL